MLIKLEIPVKSKLARYIGIPTQHQICQGEDETQDHLVYQCPKPKDI